MPEVKARRLPLLLLGLLLSAGLARLGLWQLQRGDEKAAMLAGVQAVLAERRPLPVGALSSTQAPPVSPYTPVDER